MNESRQKALEMKDQLVQDFQEIRNKYPADFVGERHDQKSVKQTNGTYKLERSAPPSVWPTEQQGKNWIQDIDLFLDHLSDNIEKTDDTFEEICDEIYTIIQGNSRDGTPCVLDYKTCSSIAFNVLMTFDCLKKEKMPITQSNNWHDFAVAHVKYIMAYNRN